MAGGLSLNGGVRSSGYIGSTGSTPQNTSAMQAAWGIGGTTAGGANATAALTPNDPFGTAFWMALAAVGALLFVRHSLPR
jgi:hypothetical protein